MFTSAILLLHGVFENDLSTLQGIILNCLLLSGFSLYRDTLISAHIYDSHVTKHFFLSVNQVILGNFKCK